MRKIFSILTVFLSAIAAFTASGQTMNYQAILHNNDGSVAANKNVGLRFRVLSNSGVQLFSEEAVVTTNDLGLAEYAIGSKQSGLSRIDWSGTNMLEVGVDMNGGTDYTAVYSSAIQSVAKAFYSSNGEEAKKVADTAYANADVARGMADAALSETNEARGMADEAIDRARGLENYMNDIMSYVNDTRAIVEDTRAMAETTIDHLENWISDLTVKIETLQMQIDELKNK